MKIHIKLWMIYFYISYFIQCFIYSNTKRCSPIAMSHWTVTPWDTTYPYWPRLGDSWRNQCRRILMCFLSSRASYLCSCFLCDSGSGEHLGTGRCLREERQHHQSHVFHQRPLDAARLSSLVSRSFRRRFRFTARWHQPGDREDRVWDHQQTARYEGSALGFRQLYLCPFQREPRQCLGSRS